MSTSAAPVQASDLGIAANRSEKSNAWSWEERLDIYSRRRDGEAWDTICPVMRPVLPDFRLLTYPRTTHIVPNTQWNSSIPYVAYSIHSALVNQRDQKIMKKNAASVRPSQSF